MSNDNSVDDYEECGDCGEEVADFWVCGDGEVLCFDCAESDVVVSLKKCSRCFEDKPFAELSDDLGGQCATCAVLGDAASCEIAPAGNWWAVLPLGAVLVSMSTASGVAVFHGRDPDDYSHLIAYTVDLWSDRCTQSVAAEQNTEVRDGAS